VYSIVSALGICLGLGLALAACSGKKDAGGQGAAPAGEARPAAAPPAQCPPGNAVKDGACVVVVTPQNIAVIAQHQTRIDELARLLDQVDTVGAPIELFGGLRQLEPWKALKAKSENIAALDAVADTLDRAVKTLRAFKGSLGEASARLGNLKAELDRALADTGTARRIEEVRARVSTQVRAAIEPFAVQVQDTIRHALVPLVAQLGELTDAVITGCTMAKLSGGGDKTKELCTQARDSSARALAYLDDLKARPAKLFSDITSQLEAELGPVIDAETTKLLHTAHAKVNDALKLPPPPPPAGSGSAR
jgi:hypothetical protein